MLGFPEAESRGRVGQSESVAFGSFAQDVVHKHLVCPDLDFAYSVNPDVIRSQLFTLKAKFKEYATKAEAACYQIEQHYKQDKFSSPATHARFTTGGAVVTGTVQPIRTDISFTDIIPQASPIPLLEAIANLMKAQAQGEDEGWDLLRDDFKGTFASHSTVGIRLALNSSSHDLRPLQIQFVIPGSSAHICGIISRGDEIVAVDGKQAVESEIVRQVRGSDVVGSKVSLTVRKGGTGKVLEASLIRGAWGAVERKEKLFILYDELQKMIKSDANKEEIQTKLKEIVEMATDYEKYRAVSDMTIHDRLRDLQSEMHRLLEVATQRTQSLLKKYSSACQCINSQMPEITVALHKGVESYIKELQLKLNESAERIIHLETENHTIQYKNTEMLVNLEDRNVELLQKLKEEEKKSKLLDAKVQLVQAEAMKAMESLAAFSVNKLNKAAKAKADSQVGDGA